MKMAGMGGVRTRTQYGGKGIAGCGSQLVEKGSLIRIHIRRILDRRAASIFKREANPIGGVANGVFRQFARRPVVAAAANKTLSGMDFGDGRIQMPLRKSLSRAVGKLGQNECKGTIQGQFARKCDRMR